MKNIIKLASLMAIFTLLFLVTSCDKEEFIDDKTQGISLNVDADILRVPVSLQISDAASAELLENASVEITGSGTDKIYSTVGERQLVVNQGFVDFAIDKNELPSPENPIEFSVKITAPGYVPTVQTYVIRDIDERQQHVVSIVNRAAPPAGVATAGINISAPAEGTPSVLTFATETRDDLTEIAEITIPEGTQFFDAEGNQLTGAISAQSAYFDNQSESSLDAFPGGLTALNVRDENGETMDPIQFETAGFLAINLTSGGEEVRNFSQPVSVSMTINSATINPETGVSVAAGDEIPYWSLDESTGEWQKEGIATIVEEDGKLQTSFEITHLSYYNLDWYYNACFSSTVAVSSNIAKIHEGNSPYGHWGHPYEYYFARLMNAQTGRAIRYIHNLGPLYNGQELTFYNAPNSDVYIELSRGSYGCRDVITTSSIFNICTNPTIEFDIPNSTELLTLEASISGVCSGAGLSVEIKPSAYIYYKQSDCYSWSVLGYFYNGQFSNRKLKVGETYDFLISYSYDSYTFENVTIESSTFDFEGQEISVIIDDNNTINFDMQRIPIPDEICTGFGF
ncbi:MAG: hypothetical protein ACI85O_000386 [Saprospiraceae bacterium]|jgi:hypothetical protein